MDPADLLLTINDTIKSTYEVSRRIDRLKDPRTGPSEAVASLSDELDGLRNAIIGIQSCLESTIIPRDRQGAVDGSLQGLLSSVSASLFGCQRLLLNLDLKALPAIFRSLDPSTANLSHRTTRDIQIFISKDLRDLKGKTLAPYLAQVSAYKQNFQLAWQSITV